MRRQFLTLESLRFKICCLSSRPALNILPELGGGVSGS
jgi:hypothetical protein